MENELIAAIRRDSAKHTQDIMNMKERTERLEEDIGRLEDVIDSLATEFHRPQPGGGDGSKRTDSDLESLELGSASKEGKLKCYVDTTKHDSEEIHRRIDLLKEGLAYARIGGEQDG